jgi:hypothetical protein
MHHARKDSFFEGVTVFPERTEDGNGETFLFLLKTR